MSEATPTSTPAERLAAIAAEEVAADLAKAVPATIKRAKAEGVGSTTEAAMAVYRAEFAADGRRIARGPVAIRKARDVQKLRWERIAIRAGVSVAVAKELYERNEGLLASESYTGRGRDYRAA